MVDDPSAHPDLFQTEKAQEKERQRLFRIIEELVLWENTTNEKVLQQARDEIWQSWRYTCTANADHPRAKELFDRHKLPAFHDPFAGGGSIPLEAQRLGLEAFASDLNPVAVLINKTMIEIPPKFAGKPPVNPDARRDRRLLKQSWTGAQGLAEDVRYYGQWMREQAKKRIGDLYPKIEITAEMAKERKDLKPYVGQKLTAIAWVWARTVKSPNPAFAHVVVPLASTFMLASKPGKEAYVEPLIRNGGYQFTVRTGRPKNLDLVLYGTKGARGDFRCLMSGTAILPDYVRAEGKAGRIGVKLMAVVTEGQRERVYLSPTADMEALARHASPDWKPEVEFLQHALGFRVGNYGMTNWTDLFSSRQLVAMATFSGLVQEVHRRVKVDADAAGLPHTPPSDYVKGGSSNGYANAVAVHLAFAVDKSAVYWNSLCPWLNQPKNEIVGNSFSRQTIQMVWDYAEANPFCASGGNIDKQIDYVCKVISAASGGLPQGHRALPL